nr:hypothetical protein [uncultured Chitinophaga sp.]
MKHPVSVLLTRVFAYGFYKVHAGILLFLFVTFVSYAFFINTAGDILPSAMAYFQQLITITLVSNPFILLLFFITCLVYNIKSWQYVLSQLSAPEQQFIFYSTNAMPPGKQFFSWFRVQLHINIPAFAYGLFALFIGFLWHHYLLPVLLFVYLLLLTAAGALIYFRQANRFAGQAASPVLLWISRQWKKPLPAIFLYHIAARHKLSYAITKAITALIIGSGLFRLLENPQQDLRAAGASVLFITLAHSVLIFQEQDFERYYLRFTRNFPYSIPRVYLSSVLTHVLLLLPELTWLLLAFPPAMNLILVPSLIVYVQLLRSLCYRYPVTMRSYLSVTFLLSGLLFWCIMFGGIYWLFPCCFIASTLFTVWGYYRQE